MLNPIARDTTLTTSRGAVSTFLVGSYTEPMSFVNGHADGITLVQHGAPAAGFSTPSLLAEVRNPSWVTVSPNGRFVYAVSELDELDGEPTGGIHAFRRNLESGRLEHLNSMPSGGMSPTHVEVSPDGDFVLVANFESGTLAAFALAADGSLARMSDVAQHHGRGKDDFFQAGPHPHQIVFDRLTDELLVPDMGLDAVFFYRLDAVGQLHTSRDPIVLPPGTGPRQVAFGMADAALMVLGEVNSSLNVLRREAAGEFRSTQRMSTVPAGSSVKTRAGGLAVSPDRRRVFASNRGHDSIAVFTWDERANLLCHEQSVACEGREPRGIAVTPDGGTLIVANQDSDELVAFGLDGTVLQPDARISSPSPACVAFPPGA